MTLSKTLADWSCDPFTVDEDVYVQASRHIADGVGCALAAVRLDAAPEMNNAATWYVAPAEATCIGMDHTEKTPAPAAALINGTLVHALDYDDTHAAALVHPTAVVFPTALAVAEEMHSTGAEFIHACVVGYETIARLGAAVRHGFHARGFHATSVCGVVASAVTATNLYMSEADVVVNAIGIAVSMASGSLEFLADGASTKRLHPGIAAQNGIIAARLAMAGASGPKTALEGEHGLFRLFTGEEPTDVFSTLGDVSETEQITIKPYPACQLSHASLDALAEIELGGREISRATFFVPADAAKIVCDPIDRKRAPLTEYDAKFSLPWCAALLILDGGITAESFDDINRPDVRALTERIEYRIVDSPTVAASAPGRVEIEFVDGTTATGRVPFSAGGPDRPLSDEAFMRKFTTNVGSAERANLIIEAIDELLDIDSVDEFAETIA